MSSAKGGTVATRRSFAEVAAGVTNTISTYAQALDDGRIEDIVATFCADGSCDIPLLGHHVGPDALRKAFEQTRPRAPQRHLVLNTVITKWSDDEAQASSDLAFLLKSDDGWNVFMVGRYHDVLHPDGDTWRFHSRHAEFS